MKLQLTERHTDAVSKTSHMMKIQKPLARGHSQTQMVSWTDQSLTIAKSDNLENYKHDARGEDQQPMGQSLQDILCRNSKPGPKNLYPEDLHYKHKKNYYRGVASCQLNYKKDEMKYNQDEQQQTVRKRKVY